jgi:hypothetical protein
VSAIPDFVGSWNRIEHPLRRLPRWAAALVLALTVALCVWSGPAEYHYGHHASQVNHARLKRGDRRDFDLYRTIDKRVANGESYWHAALAEQRRSRYPTKPFMAVRPPTLAWATLVLGLTGWRVVAFGLWLVAALGMIPLFKNRAKLIERLGAVVTAGAFGSSVDFLVKVGLSHEILAGAFLSAALVVYRPKRWWPSLLLAACGLAIRELALPFVLLWAVFAASQRRWREFAAVLVVLALFAIGMALHAQAVAAERLPGDLTSPGWTGMQGLPFTLYGLVSVIGMGKLPFWLGPPLVLLPLLGWVALGGRTGLFGTLWFGGFLLATSLFARQENFYWLSLVLPAYGAGLALVPRAIYDLVTALRRRRRAEDGGFQAA